MAGSWKSLWDEIAIELNDREQARRIAEQVSGKFGSDFLLFASEPALDSDAERVHKMAKRRAAGEPLQYVLGSWGFRSLDLLVDQRVLIPRPETEQVVEAALATIANIQSPLVVDLGTGSGAIALAIASEVPNASVYATDVSEAALAVAKENSELVGTSNVELTSGSWFDALPASIKGDIDLIVSNPPYVSDADEVQEIVREWEPHSALFSGADGLDDIRVIIASAAHWLKPRGHLFIEHGPNQADAIVSLARASGFAEASTGIDFAGRKRWLAARSA